MSYLSDVVDYLNAQSVATTGTDLFQGYLPNDPDTAMAVLATGGTEPDTEIPTESPTFQVLIRSTTFPTGETNLANVRTALHQVANQTLVTDQNYFYFILAISEGGNIGQDKAGNFLFSINFRSLIR